MLSFKKNEVLFESFISLSCIRFDEKKKTCDNLNKTGKRLYGFRRRKRRMKKKRGCFRR